MCVCRPGLPARSLAKTSLSIRTATCFFFGPLGRPPFPTSAVSDSGVSTPPLDGRPSAR